MTGRRLSNAKMARIISMRGKCSVREISRWADVSWTTAKRYLDEGNGSGSGAEAIYEAAIRGMAEPFIHTGELVRVNYPAILEAITQTAALRTKVDQLGRKTTVICSTYPTGGLHLSYLAERAVRWLGMQDPGGAERIKYNLKKITADYDFLHEAACDGRLLW